MSLRPLCISSIVSMLLAAGVFSRPACCGAEDVHPADDLPAGAIRLRRVYAPADRLKDWPLGGRKYMPIEPAEFERLLSRSRIETPGATASIARCADAQYSARLVGDRLTAGQATLEVRHAGEAPARLVLDPCGLAIGKANWDGENPTRAILGLGPDGKLATRVAASGKLEFDWSLAGRRDAAEVLSFQVELPRCPNNRLSVELPENLTPAADRGIVLPAGRTDDGFRRWRIELGGHNRFRLRAQPAGTSGRRLQLALVRQSLVYDFSPRGLDLSAELKFEVHNEPLGQVTLVLDGQLQLISARCGEAPVPWSITAGKSDSAPDGPESRLLLTLPEPIQDTERVLQLRALAPLVTDRPWKLPRIRTEGTFWQEGSARLTVPVPLLIKQIVPIGCRQSDTGPLSAPRVGESAEFQYFTPEGTVQVVLSRRSVPVQLASGTAIELAPGEMTGRVIADFRIADASQFSLTADVARQWLIDSVESLPPEVMDDWTLKDKGGKRRLAIRLAKALSPVRPVRILISARRLRSPLGQTLRIDDLAPVRFQVTGKSRRLVAARAVGPYRLKLAGAEGLNHVNTRGLESAELELFAEPPPNLLFEDDPGAADLEVSLVARKPSYTGTIRVEASVGDGTLGESYFVHCSPESARLQRVLVYFSHRRDVPLRWTLGAGGQGSRRAAGGQGSRRADGNQQLPARQLSIEEHVGAGLPPGGEAWELTLLPARSVPFKIRGAREMKLTDRQPVSLASLPEATAQQATLVIRSFGPNAVGIKNNRLRSIPGEAVPPDRYQTARATYRYDPAGDTQPAPQPALTVWSRRDTAAPPGWVWDCQLESRYEANGAGQHLASYRLQNAGGQRIRLILPPESDAEHVRGVWVNGNRVLWHSSGSATGVTSYNQGGSATGVASYNQGDLWIDLPRGQKYTAVSIHFTTSRSPLGLVGSLEPPLPKCDLPVLFRHWTVWLPPGYDTYDPDPRWQAPSAPAMSWSQRLFGPLGRPSGKLPFDPLANGEGEAPAEQLKDLKDADARRPDHATGPVEGRKGQPAEPKVRLGRSLALPGRSLALPGFEPADTRGWTACRLFLKTSATGPVRLKFVHRQGIRLLGSVTFLLVLGLGWWKAAGRPVLLTSLLGVFGFVALVISEAYVPVASGAVLGILFCLALGLVGRTRD